MKIKRLIAVGFIILNSAFRLFTHAQGTAFTYQGRLNDGVDPANGVYDLRFDLFAVGAGGFPATITLTNPAVAISNGLFTVTLDFPPGLFDGSARWLEIGVRPGGGGAFSTLAPRQKITATPYAITAGNLTGTAAGNGSGLTNVNAATLNGLSASNFWNTAGNSGTTFGVNFVGTTDLQPLLFKVNDAPALALYPNSTSPNIIGGFGGNGFAVGRVGATISGGGLSGGPNLVSADFGTVGGGANNGADGEWATIGGGFVNHAGSVSTVSGGSNNLAAAAYASTIAGGIQNVISADIASVGGGQNNNISGFGGTIGGGLNNVASGNYSTIPGGNGNTAGGYVSLAAGYRANAAHDGAFVWADSTFAAFNSTANDQFLIRAGGGVAIGTNTPTAMLDVVGSLRSRGTIRSGSETGTSQVPSPAGLVVRRINSTSSSSSQVVARTDYLTLERDGSSGGFLIRYLSTPGLTTVACMGINSSGTPVNFFAGISPSGSGTLQLYTDVQNIVHFECTFGRTYDSGQHLTQVTLSRYPADNYWSGTLMSTYDQ